MQFCGAEPISIGPVWRSYYVSHSDLSDLGTIFFARSDRAVLGPGFAGNIVTILRETVCFRSRYGTSHYCVITVICINLLWRLTARFTGMAPKGNTRKNAGRSNQKAGAHTLPARSQDIKRGIRASQGHIAAANVQRGWLMLRCAFRFAQYQTEAVLGIPQHTISCIRKCRYWQPCLC